MKDALYDWGGLNTWLFRLINSIYGVAYEQAMQMLTALGDKENFRYYFAAVVACLAIEQLLRKAHGEDIGKPEMRQAAALLVTLVMSYVACGFAVGSMKLLIALPRPFMLENIRATMHFPGPYPNPAEYYATFPSSHAATVASIVTALWYKFNHRFMHYAGIALVFMVCWSRIALGMHFPADVAAGVIVASFITCFVRLYVYRMMRVALPGQPPIPVPAAATGPYKR